MKKSIVTFQFTGTNPDEVAKAFYDWYVDGGLEDTVVDTLTENTGLEIETKEIDNDNFIIKLESK